MRLVLRFLARLTQVVVIGSVLAVAVLLILEAVGDIDGSWRQSLAEAVADTAAPDDSQWIAALVFLVLAPLSLLLAISQLVPRPRGTTLMLNVDDDDLGSTDLSGRAVISAIDNQAKTVPGVVDTNTRVTRKRVDVELRVDDRADLAEVEQTARQLLGHGFWIDLGLADLAVDITISHHPRPPRVR